MKRSYRYLDWIMAGFVTILVVSNIASSAKIVTLGFSLFGVPLAFDAGTILFPVSYIFGDILTESLWIQEFTPGDLGPAFFCLALTSLTFWLVRAPSRGKHLGKLRRRKRLMMPILGRGPVLVES